MRTYLPIIPLLLLMTTYASSYESIILTGGFSRQDPGGAIELESNYSYYGGVGLELIDDLFMILKFTAPIKYDGAKYPLMVDINDVDTELNFHQFTVFDIVLTGHYFIRLFDQAKVHPKLFGGLGLHWLYNSRQVEGESDVTFYGIGPEFGLGAVWQTRPNLYFDFTVSVKFPYYNEYNKEGAPKVAVGLDEQILAFNLSLYYLLRWWE